MVVALLALFVALDGPATAARLIDGKSIRKNSITNRQVRNGTLGTEDLSGKARKTLQATPTGSVGAAQIAPKALDASKLADNAVGSSALADRGVQTGDLADGLIGAAQLAPGAVTASKIADNAVGSGQVADGSLQTRDLGEFSGSVSVSFTSFDPHTCQLGGPFPPQPSAAGQDGAMIRDDTIVVTAPVGWPDQLLVSGNPGANHTLRLIVCNPTATDIDVPASFRPPGAPPVFRYVAFDTP